jgi:hypothetical protein
MLTFCIQTDGELFDDPFKFDPFRYSRIREASAATYSNLEKESINDKARLRISALFQRVFNSCHSVMESTLVLEDSSLILSSR